MEVYYFLNKCATTVFFLLNHIVAYCFLTCGSLLITGVQSTPNFTSCFYLNTFICLAVEECGGVHICVHIFIHVYSHIYTHLKNTCICIFYMFVTFPLFKIEYE